MTTRSINLHLHLHLHLQNLFKNLRLRIAIVRSAWRQPNTSKHTSTNKAVFRRRYLNRSVQSQPNTETLVTCSTDEGGPPTATDVLPSRSFISNQKCYRVQRLMDSKLLEARARGFLWINDLAWSGTGSVLDGIGA